MLKLTQFREYRITVNPILKTMLLTQVNKIRMNQTKKV